MPLTADTRRRSTTDRPIAPQAIEARKRIAATSLAKRDIVRCLATSPTQLYRLLDQTNYRKSVDQMVRLLQVLGCDVELVVNAKTA